MRSFAAAVSVLAALALPAAAQARDATITSFDGTQIQLSFFPSANGGVAPTVLEGHGWGGSRDTDENSSSSEQTGNVGVGPLRRAGFNVLTWDARGFGNSGGTVEVDSPDADVAGLLAARAVLIGVARAAPAVPFQHGGRLLAGLQAGGGEERQHDLGAVGRGDGGVARLGGGGEQEDGREGEQEAHGSALVPGKPARQPV